MQVDVGFVNIGVHNDILSLQIIVYEMLKVRVIDGKSGSICNRWRQWLN